MVHLGGQIAIWCMVYFIISGMMIVWRCHPLSIHPQMQSGWQRQTRMMMLEFSCIVVSNKYTKISSCVSEAVGAILRH